MLFKPSAEDGLTGMSLNLPSTDDMLRMIVPTVLALVIGIVLLIIGTTAGTIVAAIAYYIVGIFNSAGISVPSSANFVPGVAGIVGTVFTILGIVLIVIGVAVMIKYLLAMIGVGGRTGI